MKETEGEWAGILQSISVKTQKFKKKIFKEWTEKVPKFTNHKNLVELANSQVNAYQSALENEALKKQTGQYLQDVAKAELELKNVGMTDYQQKYNDILSDYSQKLKDAAPACKNLAYEEFALNKQRLQMLDEQKRTQAQLVSQAAVNQSQYGRYSPYSAQIQALEDSLNQDLAGGMSVPDAYGKQDRGFTQLQAQWLQQANDQILTYNEKLEEVGKTTEEIAKIQFNRQIQSWQDMKANATDPALIAALDNIIAKANELHNIEYPKTFGEGWKKGIDGVKSDMISVGSFGEQMAQTTSDAMATSFSDGFFAVFEEGIDGLGDAFENFAESIIKSMIDIQAQQLAMGIMSNLGGLFTSSWSGTNYTDYAGIGGRHKGGEVKSGTESFKRYVPTALFNSAPRLHSGLMSDEFPAILQKGEMVIPKDGWKNGSSNTNIDVRIHNEGGESMEIKRTESQPKMDGMVLDIWIDAFQRNRKGIRNMLGG